MAGHKQRVCRRGSRPGAVQQDAHFGDYEHFHRWGQLKGLVIEFSLSVILVQLPAWHMLKIGLQLDSTLPDSYCC